jgi:hypothetical protein
VAILRGWLKTRADFLEQERRYEAEMQRMERDRDYWRQAHDTLTSTMTVLTQQNSQMLDWSKTSVELLRGLSAATSRAPDRSP